MLQRTVTMPVKRTEVYTRPTWKHVATPCQPPTFSGQKCTRVQVVHEQAYRDVIDHKTAQQMTYDCCSGWSRETPRSDACMKREFLIKKIFNFILNKEFHDYMLYKT